MIDLSYMIPDMTDIKIKTTNPFSGESAMLTKEEYDLYQTIKDAEIKEDYDDASTNQREAMNREIEELKKLL